jgi:hypothetical protein
MDFLAYGAISEASEAEIPPSLSTAEDAARPILVKGFQPKKLVVLAKLEYTPIYQIYENYISPKFVFSRTGTQASYIDKNGFIKYAAANVPRFEGAAQRLLLEAPFNSEILSTNDFTGYWTTNFTGPTQNQGLGPDNVINGWEFSDGTGPTTHITAQSITVASGADVCASVIVRYNAKQFVNLNIGNGSNIAGVQINLLAGTIVTYQLGTGLVRGARIIPLANGYYLVQLIGAVPATTSYQIDYKPATGAGDYGNTSFTFGQNGTVWAIFAGETSFFPSFVQTTASAVAVGRDSVYAPLSGFGVTQACTITGVAMLKQVATSQTEGIIAINDTTDDNFFYIRVDGDSVTFNQVVAGTDDDAPELGNITAGVPFRYAFILNGDGSASGLLEGGSWADVSGGLTTMSRLRLGGREALGFSQNGEQTNFLITPGALSKSSAAARMARTPLT